MPDYRLYLLDADGHITRVQEAACDDDGAAVAAAERLGHGEKVEIWNRARRVAQVQPDAAR